MSVIAPKFRLGYLIKGITDNIFWIIVLLTLIGIPVVQIVLIYIDFPVIDGEIWNPFRVFDAMTHPERALPLVKISCKLIFSKLWHFLDLDLQH